jgi:predicted NBD/HSP70 family sugar kinase
VETPTSSGGLRNQTRNLILDAIRTSGSHTRADLAQSLGISTSTVAHAVGKLIDLGLVEETTSEEKGPGSGSGRPRKVLRLAETGTVLAGVDFGNALLSVVLGNPAGDVLASTSTECDVENGPDAAIATAVGTIRELLDESGLARVTHVCIAFPMPVSVQGEVLLGTHLSRWAGLRPAALFEKELGTPVTVMNDAQLEAYGETLRGAATGHSNVLYVKVGRGIGSSFIIDGNVARGSRGLAGDIGHIKVAGRTELCKCGERGCLEVAIGLNAIKEQIVHTHVGVEIDPSDFSEIDGVTRRLLFDAGKTLGSILGPICRLLDPKVIVIGGEVARIDTAFIEGVRNHLRETYPVSDDLTEFVRPSALMPLSGATGALLFAAKGNHNY